MESSSQLSRALQRELVNWGKKPTSAEFQQRYNNPSSAGHFWEDRPLTLYWHNCSLFYRVLGLNFTKGGCWSCVICNRRVYMRNWDKRKWPKIKSWKGSKNSYWLVCFMSTLFVSLMTGIWIYNSLAQLLSVSTVLLSQSGGRRKLHKWGGRLGTGFSPQTRTGSQWWRGECW